MNPPCFLVFPLFDQKSFNNLCDKFQETFLVRFSTCPISIFQYRDIPQPNKSEMDSEGVRVFLFVVVAILFCVWNFCLLKRDSKQVENFHFLRLIFLMNENGDGNMLIAIEWTPLRAVKSKHNDLNRLVFLFVLPISLPEHRSKKFLLKIHKLFLELFQIKIAHNHINFIFYSHRFHKLKTFLFFILRSWIFYRILR